MEILYIGFEDLLEKVILLWDVLFYLTEVYVSESKHQVYVLILVFGKKKNTIYRNACFFFNLLN